MVEKIKKDVEVEINLELNRKQPKNVSYDMGSPDDISGSKKTRADNKREKQKDRAVLGGIAYLLSGVFRTLKLILTPIVAIGSLLILALFPLFKPFLLLFLKVGLLMYKWLSGVVNTIIETPGGTEIVTSGIISAVIVGLAKVFGVLAGVLSVGLAPLALVFGVIFAIVSVISNWEQVKENWNTLWTWVGGIWENIKTNVKSNWAVLWNWIGGLWDNIKTNVKEDWNALWDWVGGLWDYIKDNVMSGLDKLKNLGSNILNWIWDKIKGVSSDKPDEGMRVLKAYERGDGTFVPDVAQPRKLTINKNQDFVMTPQGTILKYSPSDYIMGMKTSGLNRLANSGGVNNTSSINVNINGGLITKDVAMEIGRIIQRELSFGGGF